MFTRKHYKAIAEIIKLNNCWQEDYYTEITAKDLADYFAVDNSRFDREKFLKACGIE